MRRSRVTLARIDADAMEAEEDPPSQEIAPDRGGREAADCIYQHQIRGKRKSSGHIRDRPLHGQKVA